MSEKKFPATPRRKEEARKKGQILKSQELVTAMQLLAYVALLKFWLPQMFTRLGAIFRYVWALPGDLTPSAISNLFINLTWMGLLVIAPVFALGLGIAAVGNYLQVGSLFTAEPIRPQFSRISLIAGAKRMFGLRAWVELAKSILKILIIGYFLYAAIRNNLEKFPALQALEFRQGIALLGSIILNMAWKITLAFLVLAILDYIYQWWDHQRNLRMTQEELKQEFKQTEGHPELKSAIKKRQRAIGLRRMMQDLKKADVVVTNPTHYAVALRYDLQEHEAPFVVAKGQDYLAQKIKEMAREYGVVVLENKALARVLYDQTEIGHVIPPELYKAVAEVLAVVYRLKKKRPKRA